MTDSVVDNFHFNIRADLCGVKKQNVQANAVSHTLAVNTF